jgi:membrane-bound lytic murein transglycosylase F
MAKSAKNGSDYLLNLTYQSKSVFSHITRLCVAVLCLTFSACDKPAANTSAAPTPKVAAQADKKPNKNTIQNTVKKNVITFVTMNSPNTYFVDGNQQFAGLEYDLAKLFVKDLGQDYQLNFIVVDEFAKVLPTLLANKADIAASDITVTKSRKKTVNFSDSYLDVRQQIAYNRDVTPAPRKLAALKGAHITIPAGTSFAERLNELNAQSAEQGFTWEEQENTNSEKLLESLANREIDYTVVDNHMLSTMQYYYPNVGMGFTIGEPEKIAWAMPKNGDPVLASKVAAFFKKIKGNGALHNLVDRYHGNTQRLNPFDVKSFLYYSKIRLPQYIGLFKDAQNITDIDWRLLAALSYQESHWNTFNTSPTNVRGLMMLTEDTSDLMKVTDRLDPKQSVPAGAKFYLWLKERLPDRIPDPDRSYMALAAYNIGLGHVEDARILAQRLKLNPDSWVDVKKTLLMLNDSKYYSKAKNGYCSGGAPVIYVESIRSYYQILTRFAPAYDSKQDSFKIASAE